MFRFRDEGYNIRLVDIDTKTDTIKLQYFTGSHCVSSEKFTLEELDSIQDEDVRLVRLRDYGSIYFERVEDESEKKPRRLTTFSELLEAAESMTDELHATEHFFSNHELTDRQLLKASLEELDTVFDYAVSIRDGLRSIVGEEKPEINPLYSSDIPF